MASSDTKRFVHIGLGVVAFTLLIVRFALRSSHSSYIPPPDFDPPRPSAERIAVKAQVVPADPIEFELLVDGVPHDVVGTRAILAAGEVLDLELAPFPGTKELGALKWEVQTTLVGAFGFARTDLLDYPFSSSAAYKLDGGRYANLDLQNTFLRGSGDSSLVDLAKRLCPKTEQVNGFAACVRIEPDRASFHWYLPDRLTVDLSSPDEALTRKMAAELPLTALAKLSATK